MKKTALIVKLIFTNVAWLIDYRETVYKNGTKI